MRIAGKVIGDLGFGGGPLGVHGFGDVDLSECRRAVRFALEHDVRFFDTSDAYGMGKSEEQLALALGPDIGRVIVGTKGGIRLGTDGKVFYDSSPAWLEQALEASLRRLGVGYVDLYQLHYWDGVTPLDEVFATFLKFRDQGKIGEFGVSNLTLDPAEVPAAAQLASYSFDLSMIARDKVVDIQTMHDRFPNAVFFPTGVLAQGLLSGRYSQDTKFGENDRRSKPNYINFRPENIARTAPLLTEMPRHGSPAALAIAWAMQAAQNSVPLVGVKSCKQAEILLTAREIASVPQDWGWVDAALNG
jgi:aryl-alcohol dehydrogenase-like predicted oxidoreductase